MGRIIPYIMENKKCSKPPTRFYTPEKYFAEGPTFLLRPHQRFCVVPPKAAPPFQTCSWMAFFSKTAEPKPFCMDLEFQTYMELGEWSRLATGRKYPKWVVSSINGLLNLVGGFNPSEKYESQLGLLFPTEWKVIKAMFQTTNQWL